MERHILVAARLALLAVGALLLGGCGHRPAGDTEGAIAAGAPEADPREILRAHLSHGMGSSPLDDDLWQDSAHAALLVAAAPGVLESELISRAVPRDSGVVRIQRLLQRGLLVSDGERIRPAFPILSGSRSQRYYMVVGETAGGVLEELEPALDSLWSELDTRGWHEWRYHFLWSQLLDSQFAWAMMVERGLVPPLTTAVSWVVHPEHPWKTGTNYVPEEPAAEFMLITWTPEGSSLEKVYDDWRPLYESALAGSPIDASAAVRLEALGLVASGGDVMIPVLRESDPLYGTLRRLTDRMLSSLVAALPVDELAALTGLDRDLVFAMAYHDVGWEMLRLSSEAGRLSRPPALRARDAANMRGAVAITEAYPPFLRLIGGP